MNFVFEGIWLYFASVFVTKYFIQFEINHLIFIHFKKVQLCLLHRVPRWHIRHLSILPNEPTQPLKLHSIRSQNDSGSTRLFHAIYLLHIPLKLPYKPGRLTQMIQKVSVADEIYGLAGLTKLSHDLFKILRHALISP